MLRFFRVSFVTLFLAAFSISSVSLAAMGPKKKKRAAKATRTSRPPLIDGDLSDSVWETASWHGNFTQRKPVNGAPATFDTSFAIMFDDENIYVAVRCFMDGETEIITRLTRRDRWDDFDNVSIMFSPRHDGLTGYEFNANPDGVQRDIAIYNDDSFDKDWDAVWRAETTIAEKEWTIEMAIPLDQIRFSGGVDEWGFQVDRWVTDIQEKSDFNHVIVGTNGWVSAAGVLTGVEEIEPKRPASLTPETYVSYRSSTSDYGGLGQDGLIYGAGGYGKFGVGSDSCLDLAINPDFGQVEVDEAVLNLSTYETLFPEKRPFFLEGAGLFKTPIQLFYSRRLGAPPRYPSIGDSEYVSKGPASTPILAATKFTGRSQNGMSVGALEALLLPTEFITQNEDTGHSRYVEGSPWTSATVLRINSEPTENITVGGLATAFNPTGSFGSYTGGADWSVLSDNREYVFRGQLTGSMRYEGVFEQEESKGVGVWTQAGKEGGEHFRFSGTYQYYSDKFDPNDLGYLRRNDLHDYFLFFRLQKLEKWGPFQELHGTIAPSGEFNTAGLDLGQAGHTKLHAKWLSGWMAEIGGFGTLDHFDDREARGGPPIAIPGLAGGWLWIRSPQKNIFGGSFNMSAHNTPYGYAYEAEVDFSLRLSRLELVLSPEYEHVEGAIGYVDTLDEDDPENTTIIGHRDTDQFELGLRGSFIVTRDLSIQLLAQLLSVSADYSNYQLLDSSSSTSSYDYPDDDADFVHTDLIFQALLRWEYSPGSTIYAVYTHSGYYDLYRTNPDLLTGIRNLKDEQRQQLFMVKLSHRFGM